MIVIFCRFGCLVAEICTENWHDFDITWSRCPPGGDRSEGPETSDVEEMVEKELPLGQALIILASWDLPQHCCHVSLEGAPDGYQGMPTDQAYWRFNLEGEKIKEAFVGFQNRQLYAFDANYKLIEL